MTTTAPRLSEAYAGHELPNSLNVIRLALACLVLIDHVWPLGGYGHDPRLLGTNVGTWAVIGFFAISGYLITTSRVHRPLGLFLAHRVGRIYPGYWIVLAVVGLGFAPLSALLTHTPVGLRDELHYIKANLTLHIGVGGVWPTIQNVPYRAVWDGSLWTLEYEFLCYLAIGVLLLLVRGRAAAVWALAAVSAISTVVYPNPYGQFATIFMAGALFALYRDRIPMTWKIAVPALAFALAASTVGQEYTLSGFGVAYFLLWLGTKPLPGWRLTRRHDISYGVYIYAFPVTQLLVVLGVNHQPPIVLILAAAACTAPFAVASWLVVEKPSLGAVKRLDRWIRARRQARVVIPVLAAGGETQVP